MERVEVVAQRGAVLHLHACVAGVELNDVGVNRARIRNEAPEETAEDLVPEDPASKSLETVKIITKRRSIAREPLSSSLNCPQFAPLCDPLAT